MKKKLKRIEEVVSESERLRNISQSKIVAGLMPITGYWTETNPAAPHCDYKGD